MSQLGEWMAFKARKRLGFVPEIAVKKPKPRAGFIPAHDEDEHDIELWQVWMRAADGSDERRATYDDIMRVKGLKRERKR